MAQVNWHLRDTGMFLEKPSGQTIVNQDTSRNHLSYRHFRGNTVEWFLLVLASQKPKGETLTDNSFFIKSL